MIKSNVEVVVNEDCSFSDLEIYSYFVHNKTLYQKILISNSINMDTGNMVDSGPNSTIEPVDIKVEWSNQ